MGWMEFLGNALGKYADYDIAKRGATSQAQLVQQIQATQAAQNRAQSTQLGPLLLLGGGALLVVLMVK